MFLPMSIAKGIFSSHFSHPSTDSQSLKGFLFLICFSDSAIPKGLFLTLISSTDSQSLKGFLPLSLITVHNTRPGFAVAIQDMPGAFREQIIHIQGLWHPYPEEITRSILISGGCIITHHQVDLLMIEKVSIPIQEWHFKGHPYISGFVSYRF